MFELAGEISNKKPIFQEISFPLAYVAAIASETMAKIKGTKPKISRRRVKQFSITRVYSIDKLKEIVGFTPKYNVRATFQDAFNWMKEQKIV